MLLVQIGAIAQHVVAPTRPSHLELTCMSRFREPPDPGLPRAERVDLASTGGSARTTCASRRRTWRCSPRPASSTADEAGELRRGLDAVASELEEERFEFRPDDEDIHMAIERRLTEIVGPVGGKLHTARSRNDQVATDMALFVRDQATEARGAAAAT